MTSKMLAAVFVCAAFGTVQANAQKRVQVKLKHPPTLGNALAATRLILSPAAGDCGQKFSELLTVDMAAHGILVMSASELEALVAQHHIQAAFLPDGSMPAQLAKAIGPAALLSVAVTRCEARPIPPFLSGGLPAMHIARTEGHFQATLRFLDLSKGQEILTQNIRGDSHKDNESQTGSPESPGADDVRALALGLAVVDARHLYLPWIERREIAIADDKDCELKPAFDLVKAEDYEAAARLARSSAKSCQSKSAAAAWYNLGVVEMLTSNFRDAVAAFDESLKLRNNRTVAELRNDCRSMADAEARPSVAHGPAPLSGQPQQAAAQTGMILTNEFVLKLVQGNVSEEEIVRMIRSQPAQFKLAADDLEKLKQSGVSTAILSAMQVKK